MTTTDPFDRLVATWLEREGPQQAPAGLAQTAFDSARGAGQRRGLQAIITGPGAWPARPGTLGWPALSPALRIALVGLAVLATVGASLFVASRLPKPAPLHLLGVVEPTGSMDQTRFEPKATLLLDGTVLVTGGAGDGEVVSAELYDPSKGVFEPVGSMGLGGARGEVGSQVRLADGRVLVIGSTGGQRDGRWPYTRFTLLYDPATRSFTPSTKVPDGIDLYGLVGEVLADGRVRWTGGPGVNRIVWYDPTTGSFAQTVTTAAEYPALEAAALDVSLDDGRHLILGYRPVLHPYASIYDPISRSWTDLEPPPFIGSLEATALPDGRVLILGDWSALFDPATGRFTPVDAGPTHLVAWTADGLALLEGSAVPLGATSAPSRLWTFDPASDTVTALPGTLPVTCCAAWTNLSDGRLLGVGGMAGDHPSATALIIR